MWLAFFKGFYNGLDEGHTNWFVYDGEDEFERPYKFRFSKACNDKTSSSIFQCMITPGILPVDFHHGRCHKGTQIPIVPPSYEFYNPSVAARQL